MRLSWKALVLSMLLIVAGWALIAFDHSNRTVYHLTHPASEARLTLLVLGGVGSDHAWVFEGHRNSKFTGWPWERCAHIKGMVVVSARSQGWVVSGSALEESTFEEGDPVVLCPGNRCRGVQPDSLNAVFRLG